MARWSDAVAGEQAGDELAGRVGLGAQGRMQACRPARRAYPAPMPPRSSCHATRPDGSWSSSVRLGSGWRAGPRPAARASRAAASMSRRIRRGRRPRCRRRPRTSTRPRRSDRWGRPSPLGDERSVHAQDPVEIGRSEDDDAAARHRSDSFDPGHDPRRTGRSGSSRERACIILGSLEPAPVVTASDRAESPIDDRDVDEPRQRDEARDE